MTLDPPPGVTLVNPLASVETLNSSRDSSDSMIACAAPVEAALRMLSRQCRLPFVWSPLKRRCPPRLRERDRRDDERTLAVSDFGKGDLLLVVKRPKQRINNDAA